MYIIYIVILPLWQGQITLIIELNKECKEIDKSLPIINIPYLFSVPKAFVTFLYDNRKILQLFFPSVFQRK